MMDFNTAAIGNSLTKSHNSQTMSSTLRLILLEKFWIWFEHFLYTSPQRFLLNVLNFFLIKKRVLPFYSLGQRFLYTSMQKTTSNKDAMDSS